MTKVRTRFAPSPTGNLHIGSLRTAVYAYTLAKHNSGDFILRVEDTDQKRLVPQAVEKLKKTLNLFGITWDEYYVQSERVKENVYKKYALKLVEEDHAFYCDCEGRNAKDQGYSKILRDPCRDENKLSGAIKLKVEDNQKISFKDYVLGKEIQWDTNTVSDATLLKSDGFPTYHLAVVVDDHEMNVSHVLRGHDWMPSTPIHLLTYKYLGFDLPEIGHLTDILDPEGGKLSKRKGSVSCEQMIEEGYLPEAILNFVILLGWAPKDNSEMFTLEEFVKRFDNSGFQISNPIFNREKLDWFNKVYIQQLSDEELSNRLKDFMIGFDETLIKKLSPLIKSRIAKLGDVQKLCGFFLEEKDVDIKLFGDNYRNHLNVALNTLTELKEWSLDILNEESMKEIKKNDFKVGDFFMDLRIAVTGVKETPPINESMIILGKEKVLQRLKRILNS